MEPLGKSLRETEFILPLERAPPHVNPAGSCAIHRPHSTTLISAQGKFRFTSSLAEWLLAASAEWLLFGSRSEKRN